MKKQFALVSVVAALSLVAVANADFVPSEWTITSDGDPAGSISVGLEKMTLTEGNSGSEFYGILYATWSNTSGGSVSFDWNVVTSEDSGFGGFGYFINNDLFTVSTGSFGGNGSVLLNLDAGDVFGLFVYSDDNVFGANVYSVTNFVPAPGALALLGLAGLSAARRRRRD